MGSDTAPAKDMLQRSALHTPDRTFKIGAKLDRGREATPCLARGIWREWGGKGNWCAQAVHYIVSALTFHALKQGRRDAIAAADLSDREAALIAAAEIPQEHSYSLADDV